MRVQSSSCCFPRELVSFIRPRELERFNPRHVTRSPPIRKRIWVGRCNNTHYYSFKIFPSFWLAKTTRIIRHNHLPLTKHWINDAKSEARCKLLNHWRQNDIKSAARCRLLNRWPRKPGDEVVLCLVRGKTKRETAKLSLWKGKYFEQVIKQLLNSAVIGYEEFCRSRRLLSTAAFGLCG